MPKHLKQLTVSLMLGDDESGRLFGGYGGPGDDRFSLKITSPTGEKWAYNGTRSINKTLLINNQPTGDAKGPIEGSGIDIGSVIGELYPEKEWKFEIGVTVPIMDPEDSGNYWTLEIQYSYWNPSWERVERVQ
ncbi:MAG TPA: hypothetical protein HA348_03390 [Thermoplasmata archaeon]|nr:hypothetical protein [Thermoplasmata archaeon]